MLQTQIPSLKSLVLTLFDIDAVQIGKFRLHSGKQSRIYFDLRVLVSHPAALRDATAVYRQRLETLQFDLIAATPMAGLPIGTALCLDMDRPMIYPRKTAKSYGMGKAIEGHWKVGQTAVIVDDLITSGDSIVQTISSLKAAGLRVNDAVVLIDRNQGGADMLRQEGYNLHGIISVDYLLDVLQSEDRISSKKYNKVLKSLR